MNSFYGGVPGQSFKFSAIFPNRIAMAKDLKKQPYSSIGLNEFVLISYGLANSPYSSGVTDNYYISDFDKNRELDIEKYNGRSFNSTIWQKIYSEELEYDNGIYWYNGNSYVIADIEDGIDKEEISSSGYCYICLASFTGTTPLIDITETITVAPGVEPQVSVNNEALDNPVLTFSLPRAIQFHWVAGLPIAEEEQGKGHLGDYYINVNNGGKIYQLIKTENSYKWKDLNAYITPRFIAEAYQSPEGSQPKVTVTHENNNDYGNNTWKLRFDIPKGDTGDTGQAGSATVIGFIVGSWFGDLEDKEASIIAAVKSKYGEILELPENKGKVAVAVEDTQANQGYWVCYPNYPEGFDEGYVVISLVGGDNATDKWIELE